jgi:hypothetical protein
MTLGTRRLDRGAKLLKGALVDLNADGIVSSAGVVTRWNNSGSGGSAYDLATVIGTAANLTLSTLNGVPCVHAAGGVGIETTVAPALITTPMTMFLVGKADGLGVVQVFSSGRSIPSSAPTWYYDSGNVIRFNAGVDANIGTADTDVHLFTARYNGDGSSKFSVSGQSEVTTSGGTEAYDYGSLFSNPGNATLTLTGSIGRHIIFDYELSDADVKLIQERLSIEHGV